MWKQLIVVVGLLAVLAAAPHAVVAQQTSTTPARTDTQPRPLDLNTATAEDLEKLPGIGPALAARILEYRTQIGRFTRIEELMNVRGIGERVFLNLKPLIVVVPPREQ